jgi:hypothetical protein
MSWQGASTAHQAFNLPRSVQHANDFNTVRSRSVHDEVLLESARNAPESQGCETFAPEAPGATHQRRFREELERSVHLIDPEASRLSAAM